MSAPANELSKQLLAIVFSLELLDTSDAPYWLQADIAAIILDTHEALKRAVQLEVTHGRG